MRELLPAHDWQVSQWFNTTKPLRLEELRGRVVVLHAFQMLCPACVSHALPQMERIHSQLTPFGVSVVGLHTVFEHKAEMTPAALKAFLHEYRLTHPIGVDQAVANNPLPATMRAYALQGTPSLLLIDKQGRLRLQHFGLVDDLLLGFELGRLLMEPAADVDAGVTVKSASDSATVGACDSNGCQVTGIDQR